MRMLLGFILLIVLGFIVFVVLSSVGMMMALILKSYAWWHIAIGTLIGMIMVLVHMVCDEEKKND